MSDWLHINAEIELVIPHGLPRGITSSINLPINGSRFINGRDFTAISREQVVGAYQIVLPPSVCHTIGILQMDPESQQWTC